MRWSLDSVGYLPFSLLEIKRCFEVIDKDGTGHITAEEFDAALTRLKASKEEIQQMIKEVDINSIISFSTMPEDQFQNRPL